MSVEQRRGNSVEFRGYCNSEEEEEERLNSKAGLVR